METRKQQCARNVHTHTHNDRNDEKDQDGVKLVVNKRERKKQRWDRRKKMKKKKYDEHEPKDGEKCNAFVCCLPFFAVCAAATDFSLFICLFSLELSQSLLAATATMLYNTLHHIYACNCDTNTKNNFTTSGNRMRSLYYTFDF